MLWSVQTVGIKLKSYWMRDLKLTKVTGHWWGRRPSAGVRVKPVITPSFKQCRPVNCIKITRLKLRVGSQTLLCFVRAKMCLGAKFLGGQNCFIIFSKYLQKPFSLLRIWGERIKDHIRRGDYFGPVVSTLNPLDNTYLLDHYKTKTPTYNMLRWSWDPWRYVL